MANVLRKGSLRSLLSVIALWWTAALPLSLLTAVILRAHAVGSESCGYVSSGLSFVCALLACALGLRGRGGIGQTIMNTGGLCLMLLSVGALAGERAQDPSSVLSVLSFTAAGSFAGGMLAGRKVDTKKNHFKVKKKQKAVS